MVVIGHEMEMNGMGIVGGVECPASLVIQPVDLVGRGVATLPSYAGCQRLEDGDRLPTQSGDNACMISACPHGTDDDDGDEGQCHLGGVPCSGNV